MTKHKFHQAVQGDFIDGRFERASDPQGQWLSRSPANLNDEIGKFTYSFKAIEDAVGAGKRAFSIWSRKSLADRSEFVKKYQTVLRRREAELVEMISREVGKPLWESQAEVLAMIGKVDVSLGEGLKHVSDYSVVLKGESSTEKVMGYCRYKPRGVLAVIGPFSFPGHLPSGHFIPALITGNTVVFKPSEKTPMVGQLIAECFQEAGFPKGVFNLLQGEREVGRRLCVHEDIAGILFTGSNEVGTRIKQDTLQQHWKLLVLEMGGKNPALIWEDADFEGALQETLSGAFMTAGQRCTSTSRILVHRKLYDQFVTRFHEQAKSFKIDHPFRNPFMGPLIDQSAVDRNQKFLGIASREGCEVIMRGKSLELGCAGYYVTPSICLIKNPTLEGTKKSVYQQTELFVPHVAILPIDDLDEAIAQANLTQYGLVASVFTQDRKTYLRCLDGLQFGLIHWNKSTVGASSQLPFGGLKKSGNHFPTAISAAQYCTYPVASLEQVIFIGKPSKHSKLEDP